MASSGNPFQVQSRNLFDVTTKNDSSIFEIPEYQRKYKWGEKDIKRFLESTLTGFHSCAQRGDASPYTFLGSITLERRTSPDLLSVVDGQQRLITLALLCCALIEELNIHAQDVASLQTPIRNWITKELRHHSDNLFKCVIGTEHELEGNIKYLPRIIRDQDKWEGDPQEEYISDIGKFLFKFASHCRKQRQGINKESDNIPVYKEFNIENDDTPVCKRYQYIKEKIQTLLYNGDETGENSDFNYQIVGKHFFKQAGLKKLFYNLNQKRSNQDLDTISKNENSEGLIRLILFSAYLAKYVIFVQITTDNEDLAFDIYEALNTTGQPLTALETFKPQVVKFENKKDGYAGSDSEDYFNRIETVLEEFENQPDKGQRETKEILVTFALYLTGETLSEDLKVQRNYLRNNFKHKEIEKNTKLRRLFVESIAEIAEFRQEYYQKPEDIKPLRDQKDEMETLKLCLQFIANMDTSLTIPILARYYIAQEKEEIDRSSFLSAVKAVTAFLVLRRSMTGNTGGIESDFRRLMEGELAEDRSERKRKDPLCIGIKGSNEILEVSALRKKLQDMLSAASNISDNDEFNRGIWVAKSREIRLARHSLPLCRFLLLAAAHGSQPDPNASGLFTRDGRVKLWKPNDFLNFENWKNKIYKTVEHVAPVRPYPKEWEQEIYSPIERQHTIGNLVLLPQKENSSIKNARWEQKKIFYEALTAETESEVDKKLEKAEAEGFKFTNTTKKLLRSAQPLSMLSHLDKVEKWTEELIKARSKNILELAWNTISPWLYDDNNE